MGPEAVVGPGCDRALLAGELLRALLGSRDANSSSTRLHGFGSASLRTDAEVVILDGDQDGLEQISAALDKFTDGAAIHVLSHGSRGSLQLGSTTLNVAKGEAK